MCPYLCQCMLGNLHSRFKFSKNMGLLAKINTHFYWGNTIKSRNDQSAAKQHATKVMTVRGSAQIR